MGKLTNSGMSGFMNGASIRFSKMRGGGFPGGVDAWRDELAKRGRDSSGSTGAARPRTTGTEMPKLYSVHKGTAVSIQTFGCFVQLGAGDKYKDGLLHISRLTSGERPERVEDVLKLGASVWVKVIEVNAEDLKYSMDMRMVDQGSGEDLDPYHTGRVPRGPEKRGREEAEEPPREEHAVALQTERAPKRAPEPQSSDGSDTSESSGAAKRRQKMRKKMEKAAKKLEKARQKALKAKKKLDNKSKAKASSSASSDSA